MVRVTCVCSECAEVITEPMCVNCFERNVMAWIYDQDISPDLREEIISEISNLIEASKLLSLSDFRCIFCRNQMHNVCNYCLLKQTLESVKECSLREDDFMIFNYMMHDFGIQRT